jgi:lipopolysaccharide biosynthesis glycosyltransferase
MQAMIAITSLLYNANKITRYKLYLVCPEGAYRTEVIGYLNSISYDFEYKILDVNPKMFNKGYCGEDNYWSKAIFYRLQLPILLPDVKKIIYADSDIIFLDDVSTLMSINIEEKLLLGVRDTANLKEEIPKRGIPIDGSYICSGIIVMNLELMRKLDLRAKWELFYSSNKYQFPDQDSINLTCKGQIGFLPPKYNSYLSKTHEFIQKMIDEQIWTKEEVYQMLHNPVVYHFVGWDKPWKIRRGNRIMDILWWKYAKMTPYFEILNQDYITAHMIYSINRFSTLFNRKIKVFDKIPIIFLRHRGNRLVWYLFKIFPLLSIKVERNENHV